MSEKAEWPETIVRRDHDRAGPLGELAAVAVRDVRGGRLERAGRDPDDHRRRRRRRGTGRPDVQLQTILAAGRPSGGWRVDQRTAWRRRHGTQRRGRPGRGGLRRFPAQVAYWWSRERDPQKRAGRTKIDAAHVAVDGRDETRGP